MNLNSRENPYGYGNAIARGKAVREMTSPIAGQMEDVC